VLVAARSEDGRACVRAVERKEEVGEEAVLAARSEDGRACVRAVERKEEEEEEEEG
jgi:hypothetical protein